MDQEFIIKLFVILLVVYATSLHEMAHAYVATWCGDPTPGRNGRLTWNPIPHLDPPLTAIVLPLIFYMSGAGLFCLAQTPINPARMHRPLRDHALTALAGPLTNFSFMGVLLGILWIPGMFGPNYLSAVLVQAAFWNLILGVFNLLPLPPLDGYRIARAFVPVGTRMQLDDFAKSGMSTVVAIVGGSLIIGRFIDPLWGIFQKLLPPLA